MLAWIQQLDGQLLVAIQGLRQPLLNGLISWYTQLGNAGLLWIVLSLAMLCWRPTRKAGALALTAMVLGLLITNITIKPLVERARPWLAHCPPGGGERPPLLPLGTHLLRLCRRPELGAGSAQALDADAGGGAGGVHGAVPPVCGGALPDGCAGGGADRRPVCLGGLGAVPGLYAQKAGQRRLIRQDTNDRKGENGHVEKCRLL